MGLEAATFINGLVATNPAAGDVKSQGDDHIRLIKAVLQATFPNLTGAVNPTQTEINFLAGVTSAIQTQLNAKLAAALFPNVNAAANPSDEELNFLVGVTSAVQTQLNAKLAASLAVSSWTPTFIITGRPLTYGTQWGKKLVLTFGGQEFAFYTFLVNADLSSSGAANAIGIQGHGGPNTGQLVISGIGQFYDAVSTATQAVPLEMSADGTTIFPRPAGTSVFLPCPTAATFIQVMGSLFSLKW